MNATLKLTLSMFIFGTIGVFRRYIPLSSSMVAMARGLVGMLFLLAFLRIRKVKLNKAAIKKNFWMLALSGAVMGVNWIMLFEAYNYTSVATATLCYYLAPIIIIIVSPFLLKEKVTAKKIICVCVALLGMVFVSGVLNTGIASISELKGVLLGVGAAALYASVVLLNKKLTDVPAYDRTIVQLGAAGVALMPYVLLTENVAGLEFTGLSLVMLAIVCMVHTGISYALYFGSLMNLKAQTAAILSYIDPVVAIILSALLLKEKMDMFGMIGAVLVLGAAIISELPEKKQ